MWVTAVVVGVSLVILVLSDAVSTTVNVTERSGPFSMFVFSLTGRPLRRVFRRTHRSTVGLTQVVLLVMVWTALLWLGWWFIPLGEPMRYVHAGTGELVDAWDKLYVAGFGVFALGVGDIEPTTRSAQLLLPLSSATGLALVTLEITYLMSLTQAVTHKRQVARMLHSLGDDPVQIVRHCWSGRTFAASRGVFDALNTELALLAERQHSFPVLYEFGARREALAVAPGLIRLLDALCLMHDVASPLVRLPDVTHHQLVTAIGEFVLSTPVADRQVPLSAEPARDVLEELGVPIATENAIEQTDRARSLRRRLHVLADEEGWPVLQGADA